MQTEFDHDNPDILWVHPDAPDAGCTGAFDNPFASLEAALDRVQPGNTVVLMAGEYVGDCNIQVSGKIRQPLRIFAEKPGAVIIKSACWFFYDTSDCIVSGFTFENAPFGAISLIGNCSRNRFEMLHFINCSSRGETACTMYMGGAGGGCNVVEECVFEGVSTGKRTRSASVGLLLAQGDANSGNPIVDNVIRKNRFTGYDYGIIAGSDESRSVRCGHVIEYNIVDKCTSEGIVVKSGDTLVRCNRITACGNGISVQSELDCTIELNRIVSSRSGIQLHGNGHTVASNCIVECTDGAIWIHGYLSPSGPTANCFIEHNTMVACGSSYKDPVEQICGILIGAGTSGIIQHNLVFGKGKPYAIITSDSTVTADKRPLTQFVIKDNIVGGDCLAVDGAGNATIAFDNFAEGHYGTTTGCGASGFVVTPAGFDPDADAYDGDIDYREAGCLEDDEGNLRIPGEDDRGNLFRSFYDEEAAEEAAGTQEKPFWYPGDDD